MMPTSIRTDRTIDNPTAAFYLGVIYQEGYYRMHRDPDLSLAYYCIASYLGSSNAKEYLQNNESPTVRRLQHFITDPSNTILLDLDFILSMIKSSPRSTADKIVREKSCNQTSTKKQNQDSVLSKKRAERDRLNNNVKKVSAEISTLELQIEEHKRSIENIKAEREKFVKDCARRSVVVLTKDTSKWNNEITKKYKEIELSKKKLSILKKRKKELIEKANKAHAGCVELTDQNLKSKPSKTNDQIVSEQRNDSELTRAIFLDFDRYMYELRFHDPIFGTSLMNQFKTSSVVTPYIDAIEMFKDIFLKKPITVFISTPNFKKEWQIDKKNSHIKYFKNVAIRTHFNKTHDLVLIADLADNQEDNSQISYRFYVKGFIFVDGNINHPNELKISGMAYAKLGLDDKRWVNYLGKTTVTGVCNLIDSNTISFLETNYITDNPKCIEYMSIWQKYLDSRYYVLQENEKQKLELTKVNLQIATFCDNCTDEIRNRYKPIPYVRLPPEKHEGWFIDHMDDNSSKRVLLLHISKEYGNTQYQQYKTHTDMSFKKEFDQFTRDGLKLYGQFEHFEHDYNSKDEYDTNADVLCDESVLNTYDTRISNTYVETVIPEDAIRSLEKRFAERRVLKEQELAQIRDERIDSAQKTYREKDLLKDLKIFEEKQSITKCDIDSFTEKYPLKCEGKSFEDIKSLMKQELLSAEATNLIKRNYVIQKNKYDIQYANAISKFDSIESQEFNDARDAILWKNTTLCLHAYFDLSDDYDLADDDQIKALNDIISNLNRPYIRRNLDGDRVLLKRQMEGIDNLLQGFVINPYLTTFLFKPNYMSSSNFKINPDVDLYQNLNESQKDAVFKSISSNGLYLIQGPPGTGKTQTIAEITTQLAKSGKKILIASQNNKAIDTAFSRLPEVPYIRPVRILRDSKDNLYSYDNLTDNLYKNIVGSLKRQVKKYTDECKYVNESTLLIQRLTKMRDSIENIESQLGDLERDIEKHERNRSCYLSKLSNIHQSIIENQKIESDLCNTYDCLISGQSNEYATLIEEWPEKLSYLSDLQKNAFIKSLISLDEDDFMNALTDSQWSFDSSDQNDLEFESGELSKMPIVDTMKIIGDNYPDILEAYDLYQSIINQINKKTEEQIKKTKLISKNISVLQRDESQINDKLTAEENYVNNLKQDSYYQALLQEKTDFYKEISVCFSELDIVVESDDDSAIEIIKHAVEDLKLKLSDKKSNVEERIMAYQKIIEYLSDDDVIYADKKRINDAILKYVNVIGVTCSKASPSARIKYLSRDEENNIKLSSLNVDVVILDETSKIPFSELIPPILYGKTIILVGDHRQLPPVYSEIKKDDFNLYDPSRINSDDEDCYRMMFTESFFGKLFQLTPPNCKSTLTIQYRMHPQIMDLVNSFYPDTPLKFGGNLFEKEHRITIKGAYGQILSPDKHVLFINCNGHERRESGTTSSYNSLEAETVVRLLELLNDNCRTDRYGNPLDGSMGNDNRLSLGVICPYRGQVNRIRDLKKASYRSFNESTDEQFMISTVDNFQGDERDIIILSMVRTQQCDWLSEYRRINVAISRARRLLIIVGNECGLSNIDVSIETSEGSIRKKAYKEIIEKISKKGCRFDSSDIVGGML